MIVCAILAYSSSDTGNLLGDRFLARDAL